MSHTEIGLLIFAAAAAFLCAVCVIGIRIGNSRETRVPTVPNECPVCGTDFAAMGDFALRPDWLISAVALTIAAADVDIDEAIHRLHRVWPRYSDSVVSVGTLTAIVTDLRGAVPR